MKYVTMNLKKVPDETLFKYSENSPFTFVRAGQRAYGVKQTGPYTYAWDGVSIGTISSYRVYVLGRLAGFEPPMDTNNIPLFQKEPYTPPQVDGTKKRSKPVSETCSCSKPVKPTKPTKPAKPAPAVDGAVEDVNALARYVKQLNNKIAALRREMEEGPKPRKARKAAPAPSYDEDMPF